MCVFRWRYSHNTLQCIKIIKKYFCSTCYFETGRTHQIRVHLSNIGHPILGDTLYGNPSSVINRQALHAYKVKFIHPITGLNVEYIATIPSDIKSIIK
mgnify:CR=1 FL=1